MQAAEQCRAGKAGDWTPLSSARVHDLDYQGTRVADLFGKEHAPRARGAARSSAATERTNGVSVVPYVRDGCRLLDGYSEGRLSP